MVFSCVTDGEEICDYLDPEAGRAFVKMTHEAYYARFRTHFGTTIDSTLHDEPTLYGAGGRTWTHRFDNELGPYRGGVRVPESNYVEIARLLSRSLGIDFRFPLLILPGMRAIRPSTVAMIEELLDDGGYVIAVGELPCASARFGDDGAPDRLRERIAFHPNARRIEWRPRRVEDLPDDASVRSLAAALDAAIAAALPDPDVRITPAEGIGLIHKVHEGRNVYLVANLTESHATVSLSLRGRMELEAWDPHTGRIEKAEGRRDTPGRTHAAVPLEASRGVVLVER